MIGQILPNNNERCYNNFSSTFREVNTPALGRRRERADDLEIHLARHRSSAHSYLTRQLSIKLARHFTKGRQMSIKLARHSTKGRPKVVDLCRGERDRNRDTRHKIYIGSDRQRDVKFYVPCSVVFVLIVYEIRCRCRLGDPYPSLYTLERDKITRKISYFVLL
jgi:hypothetical protein